MLVGLCWQAFTQALFSFYPRDSVSLLFSSFIGSVRWPHGIRRSKKSWNVGLQIAGKCIFLGFSWSFRDFMGSFEEKLTRKIHTTFLYACLFVSKPKSLKKRWIEFFKHMKRLSFISQFKTAFLQLFTCCRSVPGKTGQSQSLSTWMIVLQSFWNGSKIRLLSHYQKWPVFL